MKGESDNIDEFNSMFYINMVIEGSREVRTEYLIYDPLTFIGTVGGTLGLFVGFSFYDFVVMFIDLFRIIHNHLQQLRG